MMDYVFTGRLEETGSAKIIHDKTGGSQDMEAGKFMM